MFDNPGENNETGRYGHFDVIWSQSQVPYKSTAAIYDLI